MGKTIFYKSKNWPQKRGKTSFLRCADLIEIINNIVLVRDADLREVIKIGYRGKDGKRALEEIGQTAETASHSIWKWSQIKNWGNN